MLLLHENCLKQCSLLTSGLFICFVTLTCFGISAVIIIINAFLMRWIPLWLYMCEAQSATHETLHQYTTYFNNALYISVYPSPSLASTHAPPPPPPPPPPPHTHTMLQPLASPSLSLPLSTSHPHKIISLPVKMSAAKSGTASNACERVRAAQNRQK